MPNDDLGEFHPVHNRIRVLDTQCDDQMRRTLLHELAHHMVFHLGLRGVVPKESEEAICDVFAAYVMGLVSDAKLVAYLRGGR